MIVFDLECRAGGHRFEGWFGSSDDFAQQQGRGLVTCPTCGSADVIKAVMAPNLGRKGNQLPDLPIRNSSSMAPPPVTSVASPPVTNAAPSLPPEAAALLRAMAESQAEALKSSRWVGEDFADTARAMHYGERDAEVVHGKATPQEARDLLEEGIEIAPVLIPIIPPSEAN